MTERFDIVVIGAGIAGASIAAELSPHASVLIAEAESQPGYHTTGRSAAFYEECYGGPDVVPLTRSSGPYLREAGFMTPRGGLYVAREDQEPQIEAFLAQFAGTGVTIERLDRQQLEAILPGVRVQWQHAVSQPNCADIDVGKLHQHYLRLARQEGAELRTSHRLEAASRQGDAWHLDFGKTGEIAAGTIVNAAGAWADEIALLASVKAIGIQPYRRTVMQLRTDPPPPADLPLVLDLGGEFYFRPESGKLWLSPHDEVPCPPCDAAPEEVDVAIAIDRFEKVVDWRIEALEHKWAGLRSFAPDRLPVYGYDDAVPGFFWFAGQGGYGIQTAPAAARLGAQLLLGHDPDGMTKALDAALYAPRRLVPAPV